MMRVAEGEAPDNYVHAASVTRREGAVLGIMGGKGGVVGCEGQR